MSSKRLIGDDGLQGVCSSRSTCEGEALTSDWRTNDLNYYTSIHYSSIYIKKKHCHTYSYSNQFLEDIINWDMRVWRTLSGFCYVLVQHFLTWKLLRHNYEVFIPCSIFQYPGGYMAHALSLFRWQLFACKTQHAFVPSQGHTANSATSIFGSLQFEFGSMVYISTSVGVKIGSRTLNHHWQLICSRSHYQVNKLYSFPPLV